MVLPLSRAGRILVATFTTIPLIATTCFILRLHVQHKVIKRLRTWENLSAAVGWLLFMGYCGIILAASFHGAGQIAHDMALDEQISISMVGTTAAVN